MLGVVAIGDDAEAQPVEDEVDVARLVFGELLLAHQTLRLQRAELAQLGVGLRQLQAASWVVVVGLSRELASR